MASYHQHQWSVLQRITKILETPISQENQRDFSVVLSHSKDIKDNKVPVSIELLVQLCSSAEQLFSGYAVKLAKALFIAAWAAYLCISEYS